MQGRTYWLAETLSDSECTKLQGLLNASVVQNVTKIMFKSYDFKHNFAFVRIPVLTSLTNW